MKKSFIFIFFLFSLILNNTFLYAEKYPPDIEKIIKRGKIIVAMYYKDIFPFYFHDKNGNLTGFDVKLSKTIADKFGVKVEFNREAKTFDEIIELVSNDTADIGVSLISITLKRAKKVLFSNPYLILHPVIILNRLKANDFDYKKKDLFSGNIGEKKGTSYVEFAKNIFKNCKIKEFITWDNTVTALLKGDIDLVLRDEVGVSNLFMSNPSKSIKLKTIVLKNYNDNIAIAVNPDSKHLHYWINLFLETYKYEKNIDKIILENKKVLK